MVDPRGERETQVSVWQRCYGWLGTVWRGPRVLVIGAAYGLLWGGASVGSLLLQRRLLNIEPCFAGTALGNAVMVALAVVHVWQALCVLARWKHGLYVVWGWCCSLPAAHVIMGNLEDHSLDVLIGTVLLVAYAAYAWRNRWWFDRERRPAEELRARRPSSSADIASTNPDSAFTGIDRLGFAQDFAIFRDLLPRRYRGLPPFFYQFIAAGIIFGGLALVASITVLPILAADLGSRLARASPWVAGTFGILGFVQAAAVLRQRRWALWAVYSWFLSITVAGWIYLPALGDGKSILGGLAAPAGVTVFLALCAYYFYNRRAWFCTR